jgi:hypothetical protein
VEERVESPTDPEVFLTFCSVVPIRRAVETKRSRRSSSAAVMMRRYASFTASPFRRVRWVDAFRPSFGGHRCR